MLYFKTIRLRFHDFSTIELLDVILNLARLKSLVSEL